MKFIFMKKCLLFFTLIALSLSVMAKPQIAAHRGYHFKTGAPRNSLEAMRFAQQEKFEWIEIDINLSSDGVPMVLHGAWHPNKKTGVEVQKSTKQEIQSYPLKNGEIVPTFDDYLAEAKKCATTSLILDIKVHNTPNIERELLKKIVATVKKHKMQEQVVYMITHETSVLYLKKLLKGADRILFSNGTYSPAWRAGIGCKYMGYSCAKWSKSPELIAECSRYGGKTVAWTPNDEADIRRMVELGIDIIISDNPMLVRKIINEHN